MLQLAYLPVVFSVLFCAPYTISSLTRSSENEGEKALDLLHICLVAVCFAVTCVIVPALHYASVLVSFLLSKT
jgi:hypothetical protein